MTILNRLRRGAGTALALLLAGTAAGCDAITGSDKADAVRVEIQPRRLELSSINSTRSLVAVVRDTEGRRIPDADVTWAVRGLDIYLSPEGDVISTQPGRGSISATYKDPRDGSVWGDAIDVVVGGSALALEVVPNRRGLYVGDRVSLAAYAFDLTRYPRAVDLEWESSAPSVAAVDGNGTVTAHAEGVAVVTATGRSPQGVASATAVVAVVDESEAGFIAVSVGGSACGLVASGAAYCWGSRTPILLSDGTRLTADLPRLVPGNVRFAAVEVGGTHACGLDEAGAVFCWGDNLFGQLGNGEGGSSLIARREPQRVRGQSVFSKVSAGTTHTCALAVDRRAFCWGSNDEGELGNGASANGMIEMAPVPVAGELEFVELSAGFRHTCGVTIDEALYCWGDNFYGQLGLPSSTLMRRTVPARVEGELRFAAVEAGRFTTCALTVDGEVYCFGNVFEVHPQVPVFGLARVGGDHPFRELGGPSCGRTSEGAVHCWNETGLRNPARIGADLQVDEVSSGFTFHCLRAADRRSHCWGVNGAGMGDGTAESSDTPTPVSAPF